MANSFNLPPRCDQHCPAAQIEGIDQYPVVLLRNCQGPIPASEGTPINEHVSITKNGKIVRRPSADKADWGNLVCRNAGILDAIDAVDTLYSQADERALRFQAEHFKTFGS